MKRLVYIFVFITIIVVSCSDDCTIGETIESINFEEITTSVLDKKRLCMGEIICTLFSVPQFLDIIKENSLTGVKNNNKEFFLLEFIKIIEGDKELHDSFKAKFLEKSFQCFDNYNDLIQALYSDPGLVIKLPDIYDPNKWDTNNQIPFLYVSTVNPAIKSKTDKVNGFYGFHNSGLTDFIMGNEYKYFPLVLKYTEDFILLDDQLKQPSGISLGNYFHNLDWANLSNINPVKTINTHLKEYRVYNVSDVSRSILENNELLGLPSLKINCDSSCLFSCIQKEERKLIIDSITIAIMSGNQPEIVTHFFQDVFRLNSSLIMSDNIWPLISLKSESNSQKILVGSLRVSSIFDFENDYHIVQESRIINGINYSLSKVDNKFKNLTIKSSKINPVLISKTFDLGDILNFSNNIIFNDQVSSEILLDQSSTTYVRSFKQQSRLNYELFCFKIQNGIGLNGIGYTCKY